MEAFHVGSYCNCWSDLLVQLVFSPFCCIRMDGKYNTCFSSVADAPDPFSTSNSPTFKRLNMNTKESNIKNQHLFLITLFWVTLRQTFFHDLHFFGKRHQHMFRVVLRDVSYSIFNLEYYVMCSTINVIHSRIWYWKRKSSMLPCAELFACKQEAKNFSTLPPRPFFPWNMQRPGILGNTAKLMGGNQTRNCPEIFFQLIPTLKFQWY